MKKVYSCLSNDNLFPRYTGSASNGGSTKVATSDGGVLIKGGAHIQDHKSERINKKLWVESQVSDEDFKLISDHPEFKRMVKEGYLATTKPEESKSKRDKSAPIRSSDLKKNPSTAKLSKTEAED